ncbi:MAG: dTDP-4-dehydrorhamnose 3,5-epimerase family protein [Marmoricola sp.]
MRVEWSDLAGVVLEVAVRHEDVRGSFDKLYESRDRGSLTASQLCTSFNRASGTVRGLHVQVAPHLEHKSLWCTSGKLFDVLVDMREEEPTYGDWAAVNLSAAQPCLLRLPPGIAHGYQTLADATAVTYLIDGTFAPLSARTIRWNDAKLGIDWPLPMTVISDSDRDGLSWPVS